MNKKQIFLAFAAVKCIYPLVTAAGSAQRLQGDESLGIMDVVWFSA